MLSPHGCHDDPAAIYVKARNRPGCLCHLCDSAFLVHGHDLRVAPQGLDKVEHIFFPAVDRGASPAELRVASHDISHRSILVGQLSGPAALCQIINVISGMLSHPLVGGSCVEDLSVPHKAHLVHIIQVFFYKLFLLSFFYIIEIQAAGPGHDAVVFRAAPDHLGFVRGHVK